MQKILHLVLKKRWFDMFASGDKTEEYREVKPHWQRIFANGLIKIGGIYHNPESVIVCFSHGYRKNRPQLYFRCRGLEVRNGRPSWGAEPGKKYFVIKIGETISEINAQ
ncbi:hypothetical protein MASR1M12_00770 [Erysipelotrichia bacterium]